MSPFPHHVHWSPLVQGRGLKQCALFADALIFLSPLVQGRGRYPPPAHDRHRVVLGGVVLRRHRHDDLVVVIGERGHRDPVAEVGVGDGRSAEGDAGHRRVRIVHRRGQRHRGDGVAHVRVVVERARREGRVEGPVVRPVVDHERAQRRVGGGAHLEHRREAVELPAVAARGNRVVESGVATGIGRRHASSVTQRETAVGPDVGATGNHAIRGGGCYARSSLASLVLTIPLEPPQEKSYKNYFFVV